MKEELFQIEVKRALVEHRFSPADGWFVTIDLDGMERGRGAQQSSEKQRRAATAEEWLVNEGIVIGAHPKFGRADLVAQRQDNVVIVEAEGRSRKQKDQAMYSALGQLLALMTEAGPRFVVAMPDLGSWRSQGAKIPERVRELLNLEIWYVSTDEVSTR